MKKLCLLITIFSIASIGFCQKVTKNFMYDGLNREYIEYVPSIYDSLSAVPLVICLHGLGDNMTNFTGIGMNYVADTANFIVVTPQAISSPSGTAWNSGASYMGYVLNGDVDDAGFINALIDTVSASYNIDQTRVYATGFSMGGFMSNRLACELNNRIAAIASVSGTIGTALTCNPGRAISVCHFHGTADQTVSYTANQYGNDPEDLVNFWVTNNNCDTTPVYTDLPDIAADGYTIDHYVYQNGDDSTEVEFYKVNGGGHEWLSCPANDVSYTIEIWNFFNKHKLIPTSNINDIICESNIKIYPNPAVDMVNILNLNKKSVYIIITDIKGAVIYQEQINRKDNVSINVSNFSKGIYFLKIITDKYSDIEKLIIE